MVRKLYDELADKKIKSRVVGAHNEVRDKFLLEKLQDSSARETCRINFPRKAAYLPDLGIE
jgi:hypothetical protein